MSRKDKLVINGMLFMAAILFGSSYSYRKMSLLFVGPFFFNASRYLLSSVVLFFAYIVNEKLHGRQKKDSTLNPVKWQLQKGLIMGTVFSSLVTIQQLGLITSDAGKCGFISALYIFFTPMISWLIMRRAIAFKVWVGAIIAVMGLFLISAGDNFVIVPGDVLFLLTAVLCAVHIIMIGNYIKNSDPLLLTSIQMICCFVCSVVLSLIFEKGTALSDLTPIIWPIIYTGVFTIALGALLQFIAQKKASPSVAAIILSFESVFSVIFAAIIIDERMNVIQISGCALIFIAIIISQLEMKPKTIE